MFKSNLIEFDELSSTNIYALSQINDLNDRGIIFAKTQSAGRGRLNRKWISNNPENLYFSIVLKPTNSISEAQNLPIENLTQYMSVVLTKELKRYGVVAQIKWPNDVLVDGKKIAGILAESSISGNTLKGIVLGVGINLNSSQEEMNTIDQPATSLNLEIEKSVSPIEFLESLTNRFFANYDDFMQNGFKIIKKEYLEKCLFLNKTVTISDANGIYNAFAKDINPDGSLCIEKNNELQNIRIGDVSC